jgi:signal transduction histidine kinase
MLEIRVRDHGSGIPPERLEQIFEEFFSTKPLGEGTGLGLPIARNLVTNFFDGSLTVTSTVGHGSAFLLRLPRSHPAELASQTTTNLSMVAPQDGPHPEEAQRTSS